MFCEVVPRMGNVAEVCFPFTTDVGHVLNPGGVQSLLESKGVGAGVLVVDNDPRLCVRYARYRAKGGDDGVKRTSRFLVHTEDDIELRRR